MAITQDVTYFILILARMTGLIVFNQILGRKSIPATFQMGMAIMLSLCMYGIMPPKEVVQINLIIVYMFTIIKELFVGFIIGYILRLFFTIVNISGDILDFQIGYSMAKVYDPNLQVQMGISASFLNFMMIMLFFSVGGHLTLIEIVITSYKIIPVGEINITPELYSNILVLFTYIVVYAVKLTLPIIALEFITEVGVGIMMKAIPQIQLFVVNIPLKMGLGLAGILILTPAMANYLERMIFLMFDAMRNNLGLLV